MRTENLSTLKIHKLSKSQYERELNAGNIDENALYLTPDEETDLSIYALKEDLDDKANVTHTHNEYVTNDYVNENFLSKSDVGDIDLSDYETKTDSELKFDQAKAYTDSVSAEKANKVHNHDDLYYTEAEIDAKLSDKSDKTHNHNNDYDSKGSSTLALDSAKSYTDTKVSGLASTSSVDTKISSHNISTSAHDDIRDLISGLTTRLNALADSDDTTLDQLSEIVAYIKSNKSLIDSITTSKVNVSDIINNLTTNVTNKPLSAAQGVALKGLIDALQTVVDGKQNTITGAVSNVVSNNLTASRALVSNDAGKLGVSTTTLTELNYVHGVTSAIQTQLDGKSNTNHNHDSAYVNVTGDTMTGDLTVPNINVTGTTSKMASHYYHKVYGDNNVYVHYYDDPSFSKTTTASLRVSDATNKTFKLLKFSGDGTFTWNNNTVLTAGNWSSYAAAKSHTHSYLPSLYDSYVYRYSFGGGQDLAWKKICEISDVTTAPTSATYHGCTIYGKIHHQLGNHYQAQVRTWDFQATFLTLSNLSVSNTATLYLPPTLKSAGADIIRIVRVSTNNWELQVRQPVDWQTIVVEFCVANGSVKNVTPCSSPITATNTETVIQDYNTHSVLTSQNYALASHSHNYVPLTGGTMTGTLVINKNTDANQTSATSPALIVGGTESTAHIAIDANEIIAKKNGTAADVLYLNGLTQVDAFGSIIAPNVTAKDFVANTTAMSISGGKLSNLSTGTSKLFKDGLAISNPTTANDVGWIRVTGTGESDTVLEIATGDDGGAGESIVARQYNTSNAVARQAVLLGTDGKTAFPVSVSSPSFIGSLSGTADASKQLNCSTSIGVRPASANLTANGSGGVIHFKASSSMTKGKPNNDGHILHFYWDNNGGYDSQLSIPDDGGGGGAQWRHMKAGTWQSWRTFLDSSNYSDYAAKKDHTHSYLPLSGGTMTGAIQFNGRGNNSIYNGANDAVNGVGGALNNLVISSWNGVSFTTSCASQTYTGKNAVSINCRNGNVYAAQFNGALNGNASTATKATSATSAMYIQSDTSTTTIMTTNPASTGAWKFTHAIERSATGLFPWVSNANAMITINRHQGNYNSQLGFSSNGNIYYRNFEGVALNTTNAWKQIAFTDSNITGSSGSCTGNASTATKLATARTISLTGSVTGSGSFDGSGNLSIATTTNHSHSSITTQAITNWNGSTTNGFYQGNGASNAPSSSGWYWGFRMQHSGGYGAQIVIGNGTNTMHFRSQGSDGSGTWRNVLHSGNYSSYALPISGGTVTGQILCNYSGVGGVTIEGSGTTTGIQITRTDTKYGIRVGMSASGTQGIWACDYNKTDTSAMMYMKPTDASATTYLPNRIVMSGSYGTGAPPTTGTLAKGMVYYQIVS